MAAGERRVERSKERMAVSIATSLHHAREKFGGVRWRNADSNTVNVVRLPAKTSHKKALPRRRVEVLLTLDRKEGAASAQGRLPNRLRGMALRSAPQRFDGGDIPKLL